MTQNLQEILNICPTCNKQTNTGETTTELYPDTHYQYRYEYCSKKCKEIAEYTQLTEKERNKW